MIRKIKLLNGVAQRASGVNRATVGALCSSDDTPCGYDEALGIGIPGAEGPEIGLAAVREPQSDRKVAIENVGGSRGSGTIPAQSKAGAETRFTTIILTQRECSVP